MHAKFRDLSVIFIVLMKWLLAETKSWFEMRFMKRLTTEKYRKFQSECLLFHPHAQNLNINFYCTIILPVVLYGY
jgi:hypothetical protein